MMAEAAAAGFDFELMLERFEGVDYADEERDALPRCASFVGATQQLAALFAQLGSGFGFVRRDIESKSEVLRVRCAQRQPLSTERERSLQAAVDAEIDTKQTAVKSPPSAARTLLRLLWALDFVQTLMHELADSYALAAAGGGATLRQCASRAYERALSAHHSWGVRKAVALALTLLPERDIFVRRLGVDISRREEYLRRADLSIGALVRRIERFYRGNNLLSLP